MTDLKVFIPCRLSSSRLPSKVLLPLGGYTILQHVYSRLATVFPRDSIFITTCDDEIVSLAQSFGANYILTHKLHPSGTSRVHEALVTQPCELALIVQADDPLLDPAVVQDFAAHCLLNDNFQFSNIISPLSSCDDLSNPSIVKCVHTLNRLIYFFRLNPFTSDFSQVFSFTKKLNGIYCYRSDILSSAFSRKPSSFSLNESIEQLHLVEQDFYLQFYETSPTFPDVNTLSDYNEVLHIFESNSEQRNISRRAFS